MDKNNKEKKDEGLDPKDNTEKPSLFVDKKEEEKSEYSEPTPEEKIAKEIEEYNLKPLNVDGLVGQNPAGVKKPVPLPKKKMSLIAIFLASISTLVVGVIGGYFLGRNDGNVYDKNLIKIMQAYYHLRDNWFYGEEEDMNISSIVTDLMLNGMQDADPYTFYTADQAGQNLGTDGQGLGVEGFYSPTGFYVSNTFTDSPFYQAGGRSDDIIYAVDYAGTKIDFSKLSDLERDKTLKAAKEVEAKYYITREGENLVEPFVIKTGKFNEDLAWKVSRTVADDEASTLVIRIDTFTGKPYNKVANILEAEQKVANIDRLVFDITDNGGGYLDQMSKIAKLFLQRDDVVYVSKDRDGKVVDIDKQSSLPAYEIDDIRIVVNGRSASASETLTLALQQNVNAKVYGYQTYGKGIAQTFFNFADGSVMRYTYAKVYAPDQSTCIHDVGIAPDVNMSSSYKERPVYWNISFNEDNYLLASHYIAQNLAYLGYDSGNFYTDIANFQTEHNYPVSSTIGEDVARQLRYEIHLLAKENSAKMLHDVINHRAN